MKPEIVYLTLLVFLGSCSGSRTAKKEDTKEEKHEIVADAPVGVSVARVEVGDSSYDLISNGVVSAKNSAEIRFQSQELIQNIFVKNGQRVAKGQKLAELDKFKLQISYDQAKEAMERATLDLEDVLIGQGYGGKQNEPGAIPANVLKNAKIRSNYEQSSNNYKIAKYNLDAATLRAPFNGVVANMTAKVHNMPGGEAFCTIISNSNLEVVFHVLESELPYVKVGDKVSVSAFTVSDSDATGRVVEINPVVDKNGMVRAKAELNGAPQKLYEGMNVKVRVERLLGKQMYVPKTAVVLRQNKKVVFTYSNGKAIWHYVQTAQENSSSFVITDAGGMMAGDTVIFDGNINLASESPVYILR